MLLGTACGNSVWVSFGEHHSFVCRWLTFIRGVVDSDDLPLNVGREILQKSQMLKIVHRRVAAKAVEMIQAIRRQGGERWDRFWSNYGKYLKVICFTD